ncbi:hypothetical protein PTQ19_11960 [Microbacterium esteraromaticum]|uniref:hypothetical protein n=1 Tax=Microbacterium esteraromaticum TaxID=57043 RepID=UPI002367E40B|nr:hypothetical protein [Microbacterium esteraromaticum]WDH78225.1 hypothetical protein PTQ19_11960 [Microbacterium esteraromaticum]
MTPAFASTSEADLIAEAVEAVAPEALSAASVELEENTFRASLNNSSAVELPVDPVEGVTFSAHDDRSEVTVTLPGAQALKNATVANDGSITFAGDAHTAALNVLPAAGAVRFSTVIDSASQSESYSYDFGEAASVEIQDDGSVLVYAVDSTTDGATVETVVADVRAPWAFDANGAAVQTRYVADGSTLTQVVEHVGVDVAYPVVADPTFDSPLPLQSRVRFNRAETKTIYESGALGLGGIACGPMAWVCIAAAGVLVYNAGVAENSSPKMCTQVTLTSIPPTPIWWVDNYRGGPCR